jgi:23S rRNA (guanosine2251-2'-O)-methyltransferase
MSRIGSRSTAAQQHSSTPTEFVYGRRPVLELLQAGRRSVHKLWIAEGIAGRVIDEIYQAARAQGVPVLHAPMYDLDRRVRGHHQGVVAQVSAVEYLDLEVLLAALPAETPALLVVLDEIQDPQNVGAILRNASFFGASGVILPRWRSAPVGEAAVRASAGAAEHLALARVGNLAQALDQLKGAGFEVIGTDVAGEPLDSFQPGPRCALVLGAEGKGLRRLIREHCDKLLAIPRRGKVDSLNVGSASAIFLYEFCRSRSTCGPVVP